MRAPKILGLEEVQALRSVATRFGGVHRAHKMALLRDCAGHTITTPDVLRAYHDCLLFLLAYPESAALRVAAAAELRRTADAARRIIDESPSLVRKRLTGSGIAWCELTVNFGWDIARWLARRFPGRAEIDSFGDAGVPLSRLLQAAMPPLEFELVAAADDDSATFLDEAGAARRTSRLSWLVAHFERLPCSDALRELLFDMAMPFITIQPDDSILSRTFVRGLTARPYFHRQGLLRGADLKAILQAPLPPARRLSLRERRQTIDAGRAMLAALGRETDAIALAYPGGVAWHDVGRGVAIALYTMRADRREPLDSHVGMMLFKNGLPVGYGGGWPFLGTCRIGVNIFAPYRGGESAFLFAQALHVYRARFAVRRFVAEPSQFGGSNIEGLRSGAFWFYYRLGFRPVDRRAAVLARDEFARMEAEPGYRTPIPMLRRMARADIELDVEGERPHPAAPCEAADLSLAVTRFIARRFRGDRTAAEETAMRTVARALRVRVLAQWPQAEQRALRVLAPLLAQIPDLARWPAADRRAVLAIVRAKGGDEFRFHRLLQHSPRLRSALEALAARTPRGA